MGNDAWSEMWLASWPSIEEFRGADERRVAPTEVDFGTRWVDTANELPWRIAWLEATGEVIAVQWGGDDDAEGPVMLLGIAHDRARLDRALVDWWHMCGHIGSLSWVRRRLDRAGLATR